MILALMPIKMANFINFPAMDFSRINKLDKSTIDKIAAGEVIERPASVLKELVENSIDAGASQISIWTEQGGKSLLKVSDNGRGIHREDVFLLWERHATSKISRADDLYNISSMGFRGEALSSIASVCDVKVESKRQEEDIGFEVEVLGGKQGDVIDSSRTSGTTFTVKNLFSHFPVRKKFLSSDRSEAQQNLKTLIRISLAYPKVGFQLQEGGKTVFDSPAGSLEDRVGDVFGKITSQNLIEVDESLSGISISGFVSPPDSFKGTRQSQYFYVNGRNVQNLMLSKALGQGFDVQLPGKYPACALFLSLPPDVIDVNIHPTKKEIKFKDEKYIFTSIVNSVRKALQKAYSHPGLNISGSPEEDELTAEAKALPFDFATKAKQKQYVESESAEAQNQTSLLLEEKSEEEKKKPKGPKIFSWPEPNPGLVKTNPMASEENSTESPEKFETHNVPFLQIHNAYILFEVESGLMVVNQQFAHERILYEQALGVLKSGSKLSSQQLLFPEVLDLSLEEHQALIPYLPQLKKLGFDMEEFGGNSFQLRGIPLEISQNNALKITRNIIQGLVLENPGSTLDFSLLAKAFSSGAKIKMGERLSSAEISSLIDKLFATQNPFVSPSGKSVVLKYRLDEFNRRFSV